MLVVTDDEVVIAVLHGILVKLDTIVGDAEVVEIVGSMAASAGGALTLLQRQGAGNTKIFVALATCTVKANRLVALLKEGNAHDEAIQSQHRFAYKISFGDGIGKIFFIAGAGEDPLVVVSTDGAELSGVIQGCVELGHH